MSNPIILDTNLLILFIVGTVKKSYISAHKRLHPTYNEEHYDLLVAFMKLASEMLVTPHTLAETSNLLDGIKEPAKTEIYKYFQSIIQRTQERYVESANASKRPEFSYLHLTDSVLLELGKDNIVVLTADHLLHTKAIASGYEAINFWHEVERGLDAPL